MHCDSFATVTTARSRRVPQPSPRTAISSDPASMISDDGSGTDAEIDTPERNAVWSPGFIPSNSRVCVPPVGTEINAVSSVNGVKSVKAHVAMGFPSIVACTV